MNIKLFEYFQEVEDDTGNEPNTFKKQVVVKSTSSVEKFSCDQCNKEFIKKSAYENHMIKHNGCSCNICDEHFITAKELKVNT